MAPPLRFAWLLEEHACRDQVLAVDREWPGMGEMTMARFQRAGEMGIDIHWAAAHMLTLAGLHDFNQARPFFPKEAPRDAAWTAHNVTLAELLWTVGEAGGWRSI